jgi:hypothetical protein
MQRATTQRPFEGDPHADYTRSLIKLVRIGDIANELAPLEVFEAICEAVARPLRLGVVVLIEEQDGRPRSFSWRAESASVHDVDHGQWRAWSCFATLMAPDWLPGLLTKEAETGHPSELTWTVQAFGDHPLRGIIECGTRGPLTRVDHGLVECMSMRLSKLVRPGTAAHAQRPGEGSATRATGTATSNDGMPASHSASASTVPLGRSPSLR